MPRDYKRKTDNRQIPEAVHVLKEAVARVLANEKVSTVAKDMGIPRTTLRRKTAIIQTNGNTNIATNFKKAQVFSEAEENEMAVYLDRCSKMFFGLTTKATRKLAFEMAVQNNIAFPPSWGENKKADKEWMMGFMKRHPQLSIRQPEATSITQATSFNRHNIGLFFDLIEERTTSLKLQAREIYNLDETGFTTVQKMPKVISSRGTNQVGQITSRERGELVTACCIVSATGVALPPVFVFPRKKFQAHMMNNAPEGSKRVVSDSGWMTLEKFLDVLDHFIAHTQPSEDNPVLLILDNHESHLSLPALETAKEHHTHIVTLVPHTSNKTQPLDRTVFGPVKLYFNEAATSWMMANPGKTISIYQIAELVKTAWLQGATPSNILSGFMASGIWPFNRHVFHDYFFAPSDITDRPQETHPIDPPKRGPSGCIQPTSVDCQPSPASPEPRAGTSTDESDLKLQQWVHQLSYHQHLRADLNVAGQLKDLCPRLSSEDTQKHLPDLKLAEVAREGNAPTKQYHLT